MQLRLSTTTGHPNPDRSVRPSHDGAFPEAKPTCHGHLADL